ncbi:MAG: regulatory protein RecX [Methylococcales bacterium]|nr:regulatory protein RecX [Methylococcales bacterium]
MGGVDLIANKEIRENCFRLLVRREHSQQELIDKLALKGFGRSESKAVIDILAEQGWQSNERFAESYARYRIKKGYGPIKVSFELKQRGIDEVDLDSIVLDLADGWDEVIDTVYKKKYSDDTQLENKEWLKRNRFLQQRGFSNGMIIALFKRFSIQINYS